jgi:predicted permease
MFGAVLFRKTQKQSFGKLTHKINLDIVGTTPAILFDTLPIHSLLKRNDSEATVSIVNWIIRFLGFCFIGVLIMGLGSLGNYTGNRRRWSLPLVAMFGTFPSFPCPFIVFAEENVAALLSPILTFSCIFSILS